MNQRFLLTALVAAVFTVVCGVCAEMGLPHLAFAVGIVAFGALSAALFVWE